VTSKRSNGEGTIYRNKERDRFEGQVTVGIKPDGKPIRRKVSGRTKAEVVKRMTEVRERCTHGPGLPSDVTVADWLGYWVSVVLPTADIASSTRESYEDLCAWYLIPRLGRIRLVKLSPADVRGMLASMNSDGYSSNTQRLARAALRRALRVAEAESYVQRNVAALTDGVKLDTKIGRTMTPDQMRILLSSVLGDRIEPVLHVLLATGLRRSEVLGLCWSDIDLSVSPATIQVSHALKREKSGLVLGEPKTKRTKRVLYIPQATARLLKEFRVSQLREKLEFGPGWGGEWALNEFVFTTPIGTPIEPRNFARSLEKATELAGLGKWSPHEFRHTAASIMISSGVQLKQVSEALGHSSISVTADVYGHLMEPSTATADAMAYVMYGM
jgi:integrase